MKKISLLIGTISLLLLTACGGGSAAEEVAPSAEKVGSLPLKHAQSYSVDYYSDGSALISITGGDEFILVPEGQEPPAGIGNNPVVLQQPLNNIYLVSSATMDMFTSCNAMDTISYCALESSSWFIPEAVEAMENGSLRYAGKYSAPDCEMLSSGGCSLAIENTMILHTPKVKETLETMGIPVLVEHSSYEETPQGRMEWIKLYGVLTNHLDEATAAYEEQLQYFDSLDNAEYTGKSVAFFYVTTMGTVSVRRDTDYIPGMIELAGADYVFDGYNISDDSTSPTCNIQMENFFAAAKDADYLIYNSSIAGSITTIQDLIALNPLFSEFKAVKDGNVYCTEKSLYQSSMELGEFVNDIFTMLHPSGEEMRYIFKLS